MPISLLIKSFRYNLTFKNPRLKKTTLTHCKNDAVDDDVRVALDDIAELLISYEKVSCS